MDETIDAQERTYWANGVDRRARDAEVARARGDAPHLLAAAELRLKEAQERLEAMPAPPASEG